jgi:hypothetical protein
LLTRSKSECVGVRMQPQALLLCKEAVRDRTKAIGAPVRAQLSRAHHEASLLSNSPPTHTHVPRAAILTQGRARVAARAAGRRVRATEGGDGAAAAEQTRRAARGRCAGALRWQRPVGAAPVHRQACM